MGLGLPRRAVSLKQNCGVNSGVVDGCDISSLTAFPVSFGGEGATGVQKYPATLSFVLLFRVFRKMR